MVFNQGRMSKGRKIQGEKEERGSKELRKEGEDTKDMSQGLHQHP